MLYYLIVICYYLLGGNMTIQEVNKILSSVNKNKIIIHFWECDCRNHDVTHMCDKLDMKQANTSKHMNSLLKAGVLDYNQVGKERYYYINTKWKEEWSNIITPQVELDENKKYACSCSIK